MSIIELDKYLNLDLEPLHEEFVNTVDTIPKKYWNQFYSNASKFGKFDQKWKNKPKSLHLAKFLIITFLVDHDFCCE